MNPNQIEILKLVAAFCFGGLAGSLVTFFTSRHRQRVEFVIKVSEKYLDNFNDFGACKKHLAGPLATTDVDKLNQIRKLGDWLELISIYYDSGYLSKRLLDKTGLLDQLRKFHELVTQRKNEANSPLNDAWLWWPHFDKLIRKLR